MLNTLQNTLSTNFKEVPHNTVVPHGMTPIHCVYTWLNSLQPKEQFTEHLLERLLEQQLYAPYRIPHNARYNMLQKKHIGKIRRSPVSESSPVELQFAGPGVHMKEMRNLGFRNSWNKSKLIQ